MSHSSEVDPSTAPPVIRIPRDYNAAVDLLDRATQEGRTGRTAIIDDRGSYTYEQLAHRVKRAAAGLLSIGVTAEQRVMMVMLDTVDFHAVFLGAMMIGAVPVPVNTLLTTEDYTYLLQDSRARALVISDALYSKVEPAIAATKGLNAVLVASSPLGGPDGGRIQLDVLLAREGERVEAARTCCDDVAFWLYSSGSTGRPKGAVHLHSHLASTAVLYGLGILGVRPDDVIFSAAKLFFAYGLGNALTFPLYAGATAILCAERPTPASVMRVVRELRPTIFAGVPTLFAAILASEPHDSDGKAPALRCSISAGEALPAHVGESWRARFGSDILDGIGSTEMLHIFLSNRHGDVRYGTTGKPVPGYELKLVDDAGTPAPDGQEGQLWVHGPSSCVAYWNNRAKSLETFHGPWTRTGDTYVRDAEGYYVYSGRSDDMLKVGGIWVSPFEVESALTVHPSVLEAAVVGAPDYDLLIKPKAFIVLKNKAQASEDLAAELKAFVKNRLAPYKYPRWIEFVDELPKTATGKIQRYKLRVG